MGETQLPLKDISDITQLMKRWEEEHDAEGYEPIPLLTRMAEVVETEIEAFMKMDPDPFDERHPSRADPSSMLGQVLKVIFKKDIFMDKLVNDYLRDNYWSRLGFTERDERPLNIAACRLILDVMPGLEASAVFQLPDAESLIERLFNWAERAAEPLQSYAVGLLAAAMEIQDTAGAFREQNTKFVTMMLARLHVLQEEARLARQQHQQAMANRPFAHLGLETRPAKKKGLRSNSTGGSSRLASPPPLMSPPPAENAMDKTPVKTNGLLGKRSHDGDRVKEATNSIAVSECSNSCSNSSWAEMESFVIASVSIYPLTLATRQMLILRYLTPMGEYQEFLSYIFEYNALRLILNYTNIRETKETRLGFEALKYLAALLCHKKVAIEFINMGGLQSLLEVPRPSVAATGVSICLYYLAYCEDAMEKICMSPEYVVSDLVSCALWLLECSHSSGRCHAIMFFGLSFQFRVILEEFDAQDGLRKLYNVISTLPILTNEENSPTLNEDEKCSYRQIVRHVMVALKRYYEAHLYIKASYYGKLHNRPSEWALRAEPLGYKAYRSTPEEVQEQVETLLELMPLHAQWKCVDEFLRLGGISLLLQIVALSYEWNFSGRGETVQSALNVLAICAVKPGVQLSFCEKLELPDNTTSVGINIILGACEGEVVPETEVQKAALRVIINCVCAPMDRVGSLPSRMSLKSSKKLRTNEELLQKIWASVRENNGIIVLLMLMMVKTPITDADAMRALACKALSGLARCETVRQIVGKLPVLSNATMQVSLKDPILQEKRQEHVMFQKYFLRLIENITGKNSRSSCEDVSLTNIHRADVVAQTKIQYNKTQLYQLIHQQLVQDGLTSSAAALLKEANLTALKPQLPSSSSIFPPNRLSISRQVSKQQQQQSPKVLFPLCASQPSTPTSPIRLTLTKKERNSSSATTTPNRSLQKQTSWDSGAFSGGVLPLPKNPPTPAPPPERITLHSIVTEYLTSQHALCKNPMVTCPQFNLFVPHKCPDPKFRIEAPINQTMRFVRRQAGFRVGTSFDNKLAHSRFCAERTIRLNADDGFYTCCQYFPTQPFLALGTYHGEVRMYNVFTGAEDRAYQCHDSYLSNIQVNRKGNLMLTSALWRRPLSALWSISTMFDIMTPFDEDEYVEFSKVNQDLIVGTKSATATIYDIEAGKFISKFTPTLSNTYSKNRATFNPTDELILTDGVLFDVRTGHEIHKFDKLNADLSGVFHPNGLEIVSNTEIWDLRTFHLLRTVQALDHQHVLFNPQGTVIYTYSFEQQNDEDVSFESSFKTLDSRNYSSIATIDVKKDIYDIAVNKHGTQIAVVENIGEQHHSTQETSVRLYDVGRMRDNEDEVEDEDEEDISDEDGTNSISNSEDDVPERSRSLVELLLNRRDNNDGNEEDEDPDFVALNSDDEEDDGDDSMSDESLVGLGR